MCASHTCRVQTGQFLGHRGVETLDGHQRWSCFEFNPALVTNVGLVSNESEHRASSRKIRATCSTFYSLNTQSTLVDSLVGILQLSRQPQTQPQPLASKHPLCIRPPSAGFLRIIVKMRATQYPLPSQQVLNVSPMHSRMTLQNKESSSLRIQRTLQYMCLQVFGSLTIFTKTRCGEGKGWKCYKFKRWER